MRIGDIVNAIKKNSDNLEKPEIMEALVGFIAKYFGLRNQKNKDFKWVSNRTSEYMNSNTIPGTLVKAIGFEDFPDCLDSMVSSFFDDYGHPS